MLRAILPILAGPISGIVALACFAYGFWTAMFFWTGTGVFCILAVRVYDRHQHPEYDDRLSPERMVEARDWWVREVKEKHGKQDNR